MTKTYLLELGCQEDGVRLVRTMSEIEAMGIERLAELFAKAKELRGAGGLAVPWLKIQPLHEARAEDLHDAVTVDAQA